jgi:hypothetical protein
VIDTAPDHVTAEFDPVLRYLFSEDGHHGSYIHSGIVLFRAGRSIRRVFGLSASLIMIVG